MATRKANHRFGPDTVPRHGAVVIVDEAGFTRTMVEKGPQVADHLLKDAEFHVTGPVAPGVANADRAVQIAERRHFHESAAGVGPAAVQPGMSALRAVPEISVSCII